MPRLALLLSLLLLPLLPSGDARAQFLPDGMQAMPHRRPLLFSAPGVICHYWFDGTQLRETTGSAGCSMPMSGTVPQVAKSGRIPAGAGPFSTANYYSTSATNSLTVSGNFTILVAFKPSSTANFFAMLTTDSTNFTNGYEVRTDPGGTTTEFVVESGGTLTSAAPATAATLNQVNVFCAGRNGGTSVARINRATTVTATGGYTANTGSQAFLGKRFDGLAWPGTVYEVLVTTTAASDAFCTAENNAALSAMGL